MQTFNIRSTAANLAIQTACVSSDTEGTDATAHIRGLAAAFLQKRVQRRSQLRSTETYWMRVGAAGVKIRNRTRENVAGFARKLVAHQYYSCALVGSHTARSPSPVSLLVVPLR